MKLTAATLLLTLLTLPFPTLASRGKCAFYSNPTCTNEVDEFRPKDHANPQYDDDPYKVYIKCSRQGGHSYTLVKCTDRLCNHIKQKYEIDWRGGDPGGKFTPVGGDFGGTGKCTPIGAPLGWWYLELPGWSSDNQW